MNINQVKNIYILAAILTVLLVSIASYLLHITGYSYAAFGILLFTVMFGAYKYLISYKKVKANILDGNSVG